MYVRGRRVPVRLVEGAFIGFEVPAGQSDVRIVYQPMSFWISLAAAALAVALMSVPNRGIAVG